MYIKKSIATVAALAVLAGGYVAGSFIGLPNVDKTLLGGDIGKAKAYNEAASPEVQAAMEQLANDTTLQKETAMAAVLLGTKVKEMNELMADNVFRGNIPIVLPPEIIEIIKILQARADNTQQAFDKYAEALAAVMNGEKVENFEQLASNAYIAYTMMERNMKTASPQIVEGLMAVAEKESNKDVAEYAAKWIEYNAEDAHFENSKERADYWNGKMDALAKNPTLGIIPDEYRGEKFMGKVSEMVSKTPRLLDLYTLGKNNKKLGKTVEDEMVRGSYGVTLGKNILPGKMETFITLREASLGNAFGMLGHVESNNVVGYQNPNAEKNTLSLRWW